MFALHNSTLSTYEANNACKLHATNTLFQLYTDRTIKIAGSVKCSWPIRWSDGSRQITSILSVSALWIALEYARRVWPNLSLFTALGKQAKYALKIYRIFFKKTCCLNISQNVWVIYLFHRKFFKRQRVVFTRYIFISVPLNTYLLSFSLALPLFLSFSLCLHKCQSSLFMQISALNGVGKN